MPKHEATPAISLHPRDKRILESLGEPLGISEIERRVGADRAVIRKTLQALVELGFVQRTGDRRFTTYVATLNEKAVKLFGLTFDNTQSTPKPVSPPAALIAPAATAEPLRKETPQVEIAQPVEPQRQHIGVMIGALFVGMLGRPVSQSSPRPLVDPAPADTIPTPAPTVTMDRVEAEPIIEQHDAPAEARVPKPSAEQPETGSDALLAIRSVKVRERVRAVLEFFDSEPKRSRAFRKATGMENGATVYALRQAEAQGWITVSGVRAGTRYARTPAGAQVINAAVSPALPTSAAPEAEALPETETPPPLDTDPLWAALKTPMGMSAIEQQLGQQRDVFRDRLLRWMNSGLIKREGQKRWATYVRTDVAIPAKPPVCKPDADSSRQVSILTPSKLPEAHTMGSSSTPILRHKEPKTATPNDMERLVHSLSDVPQTSRQLQRILDRTGDQVALLMSRALHHGWAHKQGQGRSTRYTKGSVMKQLPPAPQPRAVASHLTAIQHAQQEEVDAHARELMHRKMNTMTQAHQRTLDACSDIPRSTEEIADSLHMEPDAVGKLLLDLQFMGKLMRAPGSGRFCLAVEPQAQEHNEQKPKKEQATRKDTPEEAVLREVLHVLQLLEQPRHPLHIGHALHMTIDEAHRMVESLVQRGWVSQTGTDLYRRTDAALPVLEQLKNRLPHQTVEPKEAPLDENDRTPEPSAAETTAAPAPIPSTPQPIDQREERRATATLTKLQIDLGRHVLKPDQIESALEAISILTAGGTIQLIETLRRFSLNSNDYAWLNEEAAKIHQQRRQKESPPAHATVPAHTANGAPSTTREIRTDQELKAHILRACRGIPLWGWQVQSALQLQDRTRLMLLLDDLVKDGELEVGGLARKPNYLTVHIPEEEDDAALSFAARARLPLTPQRRKALLHAVQTACKTPEDIPLFLRRHGIPSFHYAMWTEDATLPIVPTYLPSAHNDENADLRFPAMYGQNPVLGDYTLGQIRGLYAYAKDRLVACSKKHGERLTAAHLPADLRTYCREQNITPEELLHWHADFALEAPPLRWVPVRTHYAPGCMTPVIARPVAAQPETAPEPAEDSPMDEEEPADEPEGQLA